MLPLSKRLLEILAMGAGEGVVKSFLGQPLAVTKEGGSEPHPEKDESWPGSSHKEHF